MSSLKELDKNIKRVNDFPKKGITFYDITGILLNPSVFSFCIEELKKRVIKLEAEAIITIEARGFIFASPVAKELSLPLILARKKGKLPDETIFKEYFLEYGKDTIYLHKKDLSVNTKYIILDDLIATGGTLEAIEILVKENGGVINGFVSVIGLPFLNYEDRIDKNKVETLINYHS